MCFFILLFILFLLYFSICLVFSFFGGCVYFAISSKSIARVFLLLAEPDWLIWPYDKDDMLELTYCPCHVT